MEPVPLLTDHMQVGGGNQISVPIPDFVQPVVSRREPHDDDLVDGAVPAQGDDPSVPQVVVHDPALVKKLYTAMGGPRVKGAQRRFIWDSARGKNEMSVMEREK